MSSTPTSISNFIRNSAFPKLFHSHIFEVEFIAPDSLSFPPLQWQAISVTLPPCEADSISIPYFGSSINIGVLRKFTPVSITVYDRKGKIETLNRLFAELWMNTIHMFVPDGRFRYHVDLVSFTGQLRVKYVKKDIAAKFDNITYERTVVFANAYPAMIGELVLNNETSGFASFETLWNYDYYYYENP